MLDEKFEVEHKWYGFYRAKVTEVDIDDNAYGAVRVFIPDIMDEIDKDYDPDKMGLIALPANNSIGGYNTEDSDGNANYQASVNVPRVGAWVWVFFEGGVPHFVYYTSVIQNRNAMVPPENRNVDKPHQVYTTIKTHAGRAIVVADSPDVQRVEITGKKRQLSGGDPAGNAASTYDIKGNQTTILLDERGGKQKILLSSYKGDYIHLDIDERRIQMYCKDDIRIACDGNLDIKVKGSINISADGDCKSTTKGSHHFYAGGNIQSQATGQIHNRAGGIIATDSDAQVFTQSGLAQGAQQSNPVKPQGGRDT